MCLITALQYLGDARWNYFYHCHFFFCMCPPFCHYYMIITLETHERYWNILPSHGIWSFILLSVLARAPYWEKSSQTPECFLLSAPVLIHNLTITSTCGLQPQWPKPVLKSQTPSEGLHPANGILLILKGDLPQPPTGPSPTCMLMSPPALSHLSEAFHIQMYQR